MKPFTRAELAHRLAHVTGSTHHLVTYSPGDGVTRYRIVTGANDYFGGRAVQTVLGIGAARDMVAAFIAGWIAAEDSEVSWTCPKCGAQVPESQDYCSVCEHAAARRDARA